MTTVNGLSVAEADAEPIVVGGRKLLVRVSGASKLSLTRAFLMGKLRKHECIFKRMHMKFMCRNETVTQIPFVPCFIELVSSFNSTRE